MSEAEMLEAMFEAERQRLEPIWQLIEAERESLAKLLKQNEPAEVAG